MSASAPGAAGGSGVSPAPKITGPVTVMLRISVVLAAFVILGIVAIVLLRARQHSELRFNDLQVTLAPGVSLQSLSWNDNLPKARADQFAVLPGGKVVVRIDGVLYDFSDGSPLLSGTDTIQSFAFVKGALAVITSNARIGYVDEQSISDVGPAPRNVTRISPSTSGEEMFLLGENSLSSLGDDGVPHRLADSPEAIDAVGGDRDKHVFSVGSSLFLQSGAGRPVMLIDFPDQRINGVALDGDRIYCSTARGIYQVRGALMVPLVLGLGGELTPTNEGLYVLSADNGRLYRLVFDKPDR